VPKPLAVPGASLPGVFSLHFKGDADAIRQAVRDAKRAAVIGGSFLGMEIAVALRELGLEVTIIKRGPVLLPYLEAPRLSGFVRTYAESQGISVLLDDTAVALHGQDKVQEVEGLDRRRGFRR
jgi:NTE family protein